MDASVLSGPYMGIFGFRRIIWDKCEPNLGSPVVTGEESNQGPRAPIHLGMTGKAVVGLVGGGYSKEKSVNMQSEESDLGYNFTSTAS